MNKQPIRQIEFFHDAVCGWCYVLSPRLRKLAKQQNIQIVQRCFVLQRSDEEMIERFGSLAQAKSEILNHWIACQQAADDKTLFNIEGMRAQPFNYPSGYLAAVGAKAAERLAGNEAHWDFFDEIQRLHLLVNDNIGDLEMIVKAAVNIGLDEVAFRQMFHAQETLDAVEQDLALARQYRIRSIPTLVINGEQVISKALTNEELAKIFLS